jgi:hypothetical protein
MSFFGSPDQRRGQGLTGRQLLSAVLLGVALPLGIAAAFCWFLP